jgi:hypothetical protein
MGSNPYMIERGRVMFAAAVLSVAAWIAPLRGADDALPAGEPLAVEATGLVPLDVESSVSVRGLHGLISVGAIDERELHVVSRSAGPQPVDAPVGIWQRGARLIVSAPPGDDGKERQIRIEVPKGLAVSIDSRDSDVSLQLLGGAIDVRGKNLRVIADALSGSLSVDLDGGSLAVVNSSNLTANLRNTTAKLSENSGGIILHAVGGSVQAAKSSGAVDVECEDTKLILEAATGTQRIRARKGDVTVTGFKAGAELELSGAPLRLMEGRGDVTVKSDASVEFLSMAAALHFDLYGGSLKGKTNQGLLEVRSRNADVNVEGIEAGMRVQGDGLTVHAEDVGGETYVETRLSDVVLDRVGTVTARIDGGSVTVQRAAGPVTANVVGAEVRIIDGVGPVTLDLDGGDATVSWASLSGDKESQLTNKGGNITVQFPSSGGGRVEAKTKYGRVDSDLAGVKVMDDQTEAQGTLRGQYRPVVKINATGDIHLQNTGAGSSDTDDQN